LVACVLDSIAVITSAKEDLFCLHVFINQSIKFVLAKTK